MRQKNSTRFIETYNRLDHSLRSIFNMKQSMNFSDMVRRASSISSVVKKYEDDLIDFGRLRNAIVHRSTEEAIAEPHDDVVVKFEQIERLISTPPLAMQTVVNRAVFSVQANTKLEALIREMYKTGFSNIPVYDKGSLVGVVNRKMILDSIGRCSMNKGKIDELMQKPIIDCLDVFANTNHFEVVSEKTTIDQVLFMFQQNRRLSTVIITKNGDYSSESLGIVVTADIIDMQTILDNY